MLKASNAKPEAWESLQIEIERRRCGTLFNLQNAAHPRNQEQFHQTSVSLAVCLLKVLGTLKLFEI
jgi:hypothetical protein